MKAFFMKVFFLGLSGLLISVPAQAVSGYQNGNGTCMKKNGGGRLCYKEGKGVPQPHCDVWIEGGSHCGRKGISGSQDGIVERIYHKEISTVDGSKPDNRKTIDSKSVESIR